MAVFYQFNTPSAAMPKLPQSIVQNGIVHLLRLSSKQRLYTLRYGNTELVASAFTLCEAQQKMKTLLNNINNE